MIKIQITLSQLQTLVKLFNDNKLLIPTNRNEKVSNCNLEKVKLKVKKLWIVWEDKTDLFTLNKKINVSFDYSEAHYFELFINLCFEQFKPLTLDHNNLLKINNFINQKLA